MDVVPRPVFRTLARHGTWTVLALFTFAGDAWSVDADDPECVTPGTIIGDIRIVSRNVFDLDDPHESGPLYRLANRLHVTTRPEVIRSQLLIAPGQPYSKRLAAESAG